MRRLMTIIMVLALASCGEDYGESPTVIREEHEQIEHDGFNWWTTTDPVTGYVYRCYGTYNNSYTAVWCNG